MAGLDGFGVTLSRGDGEETETFAEIGNITNLSGPGMSRDTIDVTAHDSTDGWREFLGGLKDGGEVSIDVNYDPAEHDSLFTDFADTAPRNWKIVWPNTGSATWAFTAFLTDFEPEAPVDDKLAASLTFKVSGKPTLTAGT